MDPLNVSKSASTDEIINQFNWLLNKLDQQGDNKTYQEVNSFFKTHINNPDISESQLDQYDVLCNRFYTILKTNEALKKNLNTSNYDKIT